MTGFGRGGAPEGWQAEVRSVNHRYLELSVRLPEAFRALEPAVRETVAAVLRRGRVDVTLVPPAVQAPVRVVVDTALAASYDVALREIAGHLGRDGDAPATLFLSLPGVCRLQEASPAAAEAAWPDVAAALGVAIEAVVVMRRREGGALGRALSGQVDQLARYAAEIAERLPTARQEQRLRWQERWREWSGGADVQEALVQAFDRGDVTEELARIASHVDQVRGSLALATPAGRRLDFLAQELQREWTTVGAKAMDPESARLALEARVVADQFREQVQNVE